MSTYNLEEQEKLEELKAWWKRYGNLLLTVVVLGLLTVAGVRYWASYKSNQAAQASAVYSELLKAAQAQDAKRTSDLSGTILQQFPRTIYAPLAALVAAKVDFDARDLKTAHAQLQWVVDHASDDAMQALARVRLARVMLDEKSYADAIKLLEAEHPASFDGSFAEVRGDIYAVQNKKAEARSAYQIALEKTPEEEKLARDLLQRKLDALGAA
jgi:predicted negative regulator of RcsB-dependent stress response